MDVLRSLLFVPAISEKMLNKIDTLEPDVFILGETDSSHERCYLENYAWC